MTHALVDATCAAVIFSVSYQKLLDGQDFLYLIVLYNVLAFALQAPLGFIADSLKVPVQSTVAGILLVAVSTLLTGSPFIAGTAAGIGNALFHVGGGILSLNLKPGKALFPGIFVAPGAIGLLVGTIIGKAGYFIPWLSAAMLAVAAAIIHISEPPKINYDTEMKGNMKWFELILLLLLVSIAARGFIGMVLHMPWKNNAGLLIFSIISVAIGKALGGILGDRYGWIKMSVAGLIVSGILLSFFAENWIPAVIGLFFFNMTMPITLAATANVLPGRAGFAFGLTTLALVIGALPSYTEAKFTIGVVIVLTAISLSTVALYIGLKLYNRYFNVKQVMEHEE